MQIIRVVEFQPADGKARSALGYVAEHQALLTPLQEFLRCTNVFYLCPAEVVKLSMARCRD